MIDAITGRCGRISVWQYDGKDGTVHVTGTKMIDRVPRGFETEFGDQWLALLGMRRKQENVDPQPSPEHYECMSLGHLDTHESVWEHRDNFSPDERKRNGRMSYCKACEAARARRYRQRQSAQAKAVMLRAG